ncbi:MAG: TlpA family protein disulfide reductase [Actinomycetota bacterium]
MAPKRTGHSRNIQAVVWTAVGALALGSLGYAVLRPSSPGTPVPQGAGATTMELTDFEGRRFSLADYRGKPVVVNFWASWCPSCVAEMPDFEQVHTALGEEVAFVGINQSDTEEAAVDLAHETGVSYRLAADPDGRAFEAFGGLGMPTTAFIDADGNIADVVVGQLSKSQLESYIDRLFSVRTDV